MRDSAGEGRFGYPAVPRGALPHQVRQIEQRSGQYAHVIEVDRIGQHVDREDGVDERPVERDLAADAQAAEHRPGAPHPHGQHDRADERSDGKDPTDYDDDDPTFAGHVVTVANGRFPRRSAAGRGTSRCHRSWPSG